MDKLFNYLLNRNPSIKEKKKLSKNTFQEVNQIILNMNEYKETLEKSNKIILNTIRNNLGITNIDKKVLQEITNTYKSNNHNTKSIDNYFNIKKLEIRNKVNLFLRNYFPISNNYDYNEFYLIFFQNRFNYERIDFFVVNSNLFLNLAEKELGRFYKKNKI